MQASQSGFFVYIHHDNSDGTTLRLWEAKALAAELKAAIGQCEAQHATTVVGADVAGAPPEEDLPVGAEEAPPKRRSRAKAKS